MDDQPMNDLASAQADEIELLDVVLLTGGPNIITTIRAVKALNGLDLLTTRDLIQDEWAGPRFVLKRVTPELAEAAQARLQVVGAQVELTPHTPAPGIIENTRLTPRPKFILWAQARHRVHAATRALRQARDEVARGLRAESRVAELAEIYHLRQREEAAAYTALSPLDLQPPPIE